MTQPKHGLKDLLRQYGQNIEEIMEESLYGDSAGVPAICVLCGTTAEYEPDCADGWCGECEKNSVKSAMILAGYI